MKIEGQERIALPPGRAFEALLDPALLRACTPGLARLDETQPGHYEATLDLKLPAISGRFEGTVDVVKVMTVEIGPQFGTSSQARIAIQ